MALTNTSFRAGRFALETTGLGASHPHLLSRSGVDTHRAALVGTTWLELAILSVDLRADRAPSSHADAPLSLGASASLAGGLTRRALSGLFTEEPLGTGGGIARRTRSATACMAEQPALTAILGIPRPGGAHLSLLPVAHHRADPDSLLPTPHRIRLTGEALRTVLVCHAATIHAVTGIQRRGGEAAQTGIAIAVSTALTTIGERAFPLRGREHGDECERA
jgi:hypothetical protein